MFRIELAIDKIFYKKNFIFLFFLSILVIKNQILSIVGTKLDLRAIFHVNFDIDLTFHTELDLNRCWHSSLNLINFRHRTRFWTILDGKSLISRPNLNNFWHKSLMSNSKFNQFFTSNSTLIMFMKFEDGRLKPRRKLIYSRSAF